MKTAFVFPGQGSQKVGMLKDLYEAYPIVRERFAQADEALGYSISQLCFHKVSSSLSDNRFKVQHNFFCFTNNILNDCCTRFNVC